MPFALVPSVQKVRQHVVAGAADRQCDGVSSDRRKPFQAGCEAPHGDGNVGADQTLTIRINRVELFADVFELRAKLVKRVGP